MLLSALLTSVGINLGLCVLFFVLYSVLRKQPGNVVVYAPRLVEEENLKGRRNFNLERLLPTAGWVMRAWRPTEDELLANAGLDAVVLMRIFIFSLRVFAFAGIVGIFVLLPINYFGNQTTDDIPSITKKSLESFSISNVNNGSKRLWVHFCAAYIFTGVVCYLLYYEFRYISSKRIAYFHASKPQPHQFTVLVRNVPVVSGKSFSETVESFFKEYYPSTYLAHTVVRKTGRLQGLIADAGKIYRKITDLKSRDDSNTKFKRDGFLGLFGRKVNIVNYYEKKLEDIEDDVMIKQTSFAVKEVPAAFVSFRSRFSAAAALHMPQGNNPTEWVTERAPEPLEVHWPFFSESFMKRWVCKLVVFVACIALTILFLIPVVLVQGLANLTQLETWFPFLEGILSLTVVSEVVTGYLPSLILQTFLSRVPPVMIILSSIQGYTSFSQIEKSACVKVLWFTIWNIFFANVLSGTALYQVDVFLHPKEIPSVLAEAVPGQASFFISYVVTSGWTSLSSQLCQLVNLVISWIKRLFCGHTNDKFQIPPVPYHKEIPRLLFFGLLGITYFFLAPLILPFLLVYYCLGYIVYRNELFNVYKSKYETGGRFWPVVHGSTIFSLILMQIIAIGVFGLKELPLAASLAIPLPILTLLFNEYCQKRYGPIFKAYSAESLIKKDREDEKDPAMAEFYDKLATAYQDPAFLPIKHDESEDGLNVPLLHTAEA